MWAKGSDPPIIFEIRADVKTDPDHGSSRKFDTLNLSPLQDYQGSGLPNAVLRTGRLLMKYSPDRSFIDRSLDEMMFRGRDEYQVRRQPSNAIWCNVIPGISGAGTN
jgi:hypothetical protein